MVQFLQAKEVNLRDLIGSSGIVMQIINLK